jgi:hypothetical protein
MTDNRGVWKSKAVRTKRYSCHNYSLETTKDIPPYTVLALFGVAAKSSEAKSSEATHVAVYTRIGRSRVRRNIVAFSQRYSLRVEKLGMQVTPLTTQAVLHYGGLANHSLAPNARFVIHRPDSGSHNDKDSTAVVLLMSRSAIRKGEAVTVDYRGRC